MIEAPLTLEVFEAPPPYRVQLDVFEGPLDLLLHLIEREKLDISTVSLAQITDEFLDYIKPLEMVPAEILADFLTVAARLICIKSRLLLPRVANKDEEEEEDPGEALARQLREYKRFKVAGESLRIIEESGRHSYVRVGSKPELERRLELSDMTLADLLAAARSAFQVKMAEIPVGTVVAPFKLTIRDQIRHIGQALGNGRRILFHMLLRERRSRDEISVTLLAVLELVKRKQVTAEQSELFGPIQIAAVPGAELGFDEGVGSRE